MASTHKSLRSGTANKRPTTSIADGQIALNTNTTSPGLFFKDSTGATIIKVGPVHVGTTAPNASPAAGGSSGNSVGEIWLDTSLTPVGVKIWNGSAFVNATPIGSTTVQGLLELATSAETQTGTDTDRAVTPAGLQSKVSDSTSTTSSTTIASSTAVKAAYDLANAALPKSGGTVTGNLEIGSTGSLSFEGATADAFETTIAVTDPTADRTITLPDTTGTVVTTGDTGTVTSTMIADGTIVNGDINASAAIAHTKLANITAGSVLMGNASNVPTATALTGDVTISSSGVTAIGSGKVTSTMILDGTILNADINASAAIAGTKISPDFGSQNTTTTGTSTAASFIPSSSTAPSNGVYLPSANNVAISTNGQGRLFVTSAGNLGIGSSTASNILSIAEAGGPTVRFTDSTSAAFGLINSGSNGDFVISADHGNTGASTNIIFKSDGAIERARIDSSGRLGLGTSSPSNTLHVSGTAGTPTVFERTGTTGVFVALKDSSSQTFIGNTNGVFSIQTPGSSYSDKLVVTSAGNVGIGSTSFSDTLHVEAGTGTLQVRSSTTSAGAIPTLKFNHAGNDAFHIAGGNYLAFIGSGTTERARIDSSGRLLVGTSTARANLRNTTGTAAFQIEGTTIDTAGMAIIADRSGSGPVLTLASSGGFTVGSNTAVGNGNNCGTIEFQGSDGTEFVQAAQIYCEVDGTPGANDMPGRLVFSTTADGASSPTERVRITQAGYFKAANNGSFYDATGAIHELTSTVSGGDTVMIRNTSANPYDLLIYNTTDSNNANNYFLYCQGGSTNRLTLRSNGGIANYSGNNVNLCDEREKKNIVNLDSTWDCLKHWELKKFHYNEDADTDDLRYGVIAQQVADYCPEVISEWLKQKAEPAKLDEDGNEIEPAKEEIMRMAVKEQQMMWMAIKALQEAQLRIETLEAEVAALKGA